ncbi:MAG: alcohol dehydrogenase catalytic domain-containing protein, partial [Microbacterium sp.]
LDEETDMRRVVVDIDGIRVDQVDEPRPATGEVRVRTVVSGVCGSDTHAAHGRHPFIDLPYHPGHEVVGIVDELGADVTGFAVGDRVTVEPTLPCGDCKMCRTGRSNICENLDFFGCGHPQGGMADSFTIRADRLHAIPAEFSDAQAAMVEPLSTPTHAVDLAGGVTGKAVAIIGAGTIGLLELLACRAAGAAAIVVTDPLPGKRERALALGATAAVDSAEPDLVGAMRAALGESADVVFDCVAVQPTVETAVALAGKGGTVMIVGVPSAPVTVPLPVIQDRQIAVRGSATYMASDFAAAIETIRTFPDEIESLVTLQLPLDRVAEAFDAATSGEHVKVLVRA